MKTEKLPALAQMLTPDELVHITAFPSVLRLLYAHNLLWELKDALERGTLDRLKSIRFFRVMDNTEILMSADDFWVQMNYQAIHLIDFLPAAFWQSQLNDPLFGLFIDVHDFMSRAGKLKAKIDFTLQSPDGQVDGIPMSLGRLVAKYVPGRVQRSIAASSIRRWSSKIGHSLEYEISWA